MWSKIRDLLLTNQDVKQTVAKNIFWLTAGQMGSRLIRSLVIIFAARALGAAEYGVFSYVLGLAGFFSIFADIGINPILTKEIARDPERAPYFFATSFWIKIFLLGMTALLIVFVAPYFSKIEAARPLLIFAAVLMIFDGIREFTAAFFRAKQKMELEAFVTIVMNVAITILGFVILSLTPTSRAMAVTYSLSAGTGTILGVFILRKEFAKVLAYFKRELLAPILNLAWPIALVSLMGVFMLNIDIVMLGFFKTAADVGLYSASQKIVQLLYVIPSILAASFYPVLAQFVGQKNNEKTRELMERGIALSFLLAIPMAAGGIILSKSIIEFLYGGGYLEAVASFRLLALTLLLTFPGIHCSNYIMVYDKQKRAPPIVLAGSLSNVFFNAILIPPLGISGAAIATILAQLIFNGLQWRLAKGINKFVFLPHIKKMLLAALAMGAVTFMLDRVGVHLLVNIAVSGAVYLAILYGLREKIVLEGKTLIKERVLQ